MTKNKMMTKKNINGEWIIYSTIQDGLMSNCYTCPKINFQEKEIAILTLSSNHEEKISWHCNDNVLKITYVENSKNKILFQGEYKIELKETKEYYELQISNNTKDLKYILRRNK